MDWKAVGAFLGEDYLRYSFTKGTEQEVSFLIECLGLGPHSTVLDVGCGPGRHLRALASRNIRAMGVDLSETFAGLVRHVPAAVADARFLPVSDGCVDVAWSLCQGGLGLVGGDDGRVLSEMARAIRPGGHVVCTAFSAWFALRFLEEDDHFDAATGLHTEHTTLRNASGAEIPYEFATTCFTPRELTLLCARAGLEVDAIWSTTPGSYAARVPDLDHPEFLVVARKP